MEAHLQDWQAGIIVVYSVGNLPFLRAREAMADEGQVHFFALAQLFNFRQS